MAIGTNLVKKKNQGGRSDITTAVDMLKNGKTLTDIMNVNADVCVRYGKQLKSLVNDLRKEPHRSY